MANDKKKTLEGVLSEQAKNEATSGAILDLYGELNYLARTHGKVSTIPLSDFLVNNKGKLTPATVKKTLESLKPYPDKEPVDELAVLKALIAHYKEIAKFLESYANPTTLLFLNEYGKIPDEKSDAYKELMACFEHIKFTQQKITDDRGNTFTSLVYDDTETGNSIWHATVNGKRQAEDGEYYGWLLRDKPKLLALIEKLPKDNKSYSLGFASGEQNNFLLEVAKLLIKIGISPISDTDPAYSLFENEDGDKTVAYYSSTVAFTYLIDLVSYLYEQKINKEKEYRKIPNIEGDNHTVVGLPTTLALDELLLHNAEKELTTLVKKYRTPEAQEKDNGFSGFYDNEQGTLDGILTIDDPKTKQKMIRNFVALQYRALGAFIEYKKDNPDTNKVVLSELAKYTPWANEVKTKGLKPEHRNALLNGLRLASLGAYKYRTGFTWEKIGGRRQKVYSREYIYLLTRIKADKITENGTVLSVEIDYDPTYLKVLYLNMGVAIDNLNYLKNETALVVGGYICTRFVQNQKAIAERHEPLRVYADTLCEVACLTDQHTTNRYKNLAKILDELVDGKVIKSWANSNGKKHISSLEKESLSLDIYPLDASIYITKGQSEAKKNYKTVSQDRAVAMLKELANPKKNYVSLDALAVDLTISRKDLEMYLGGFKIPDEVIDAIEQLYAETKRG